MEELPFPLRIWIRKISWSVCENKISALVVKTHFIKTLSIIFQKTFGLFGIFPNFLAFLIFVFLGYSLRRQFKSRPLGPGYSIVRDHKMIGLSEGPFGPPTKSNTANAGWFVVVTQTRRAVKMEKMPWPTRFLGLKGKGEWPTPWRGYKMDPNFWKTYIFFVSLGRWFYPLGLPWYARKGNLFFKINVHPRWGSLAVTICWWNG